MAPSDEQQLQLLYQITVSDLAYFKSQQWNVTYYAFLVEASVVGVAQLLPRPYSLLDRGLLSLLAIAAAVVALFVLQKLQRSISVRDSRLHAVRESFGQAFQHAWSAEHKHDDPIPSVHLLRGGIVVTTILTIWLVGFRLGAT